MRVAMCASSGPRCGIAAYTRHLTGALLATPPAGEALQVELAPVPYADRDPATLAALAEQLNAADLVHLQHEYTFFGGIAPGASSLPRLLGKLRRPWLITAHTVFTAAELLRVEQERRPRQRVAKLLLSRMPGYRRAVERDPFRGAAAVIVHTAAARARMVARGIPGERVHVLPAGIPPAEPVEAERVEELRARLGWTRERPARTLTIFGFVTPDKGYETALAALAGLPPAARLLIAGGTRVEREAGYLQALREEIRRRGLEARVAISGYLDEPDVAAAMALTDLVLAPHTAANGSYSVMVALSYGKAVLASDLPCFRELHEEGAGVELFDPGDEGMLAERAGFLLASAPARRRLEEQAASCAARRGWPAVARRTLEIYREVLQEARSRPPAAWI